MVEVIAYIILGLVALGVIFERHLERKTEKVERQQLLDRIMAKTLPEYIEAQAKLEKASMRVVSVDELKKEIAIEPEQGIEI